MSFINANNFKKIGKDPENVSFFVDPQTGLQIIKIPKKHIEQAQSEDNLKKTDLDRRVVETLRLLDNFPLTATRKKILKIWLSTDLSEGIVKFSIN